MNVFNQEFNILRHTTAKRDGLHTACLHGGTPGTVFTWHVEEYHLFSADYQIDGADKVWYTIPSYYMHNFFERQRRKPFPLPSEGWADRANRTSRV